MGDNAKKTWEWHNTVVGEGYQAKGVVRQRHSEEFSAKVVDLRVNTANTKPTEQRHTTSRSTSSTVQPIVVIDKSKSKKLKKHRRKSDSDSSEDEQPLKIKRSKFNPLLQAFSVRLRDNLHQSTK